MILFGSWDDLFRVLVVGVMAYASLILFLRISGKRTLSKLNAFDFVVTVALGSTLATILLSEEVSLSEGALALITLIGLQWLISWMTVRVRMVGKMVKSEPSLLYFQGSFLEGAMKKERVARSEVHQALRSWGASSMDEVEAVVLETDGTLSIMKKAPPLDAPPMEEVRRKGL